MTGMSNLHRLPFAAIGCAPHRPILLVAHSVATIPEYRSNSGIRAIPQHLAQFAISDFISNLCPELEVIPPVIYAPRAVGIHVDTLICIGD